MDDCRLSVVAIDSDGTRVIHVVSSPCSALTGEAAVCVAVAKWRSIERWARGDSAAAVGAPLEGAPSPPPPGHLSPPSAA
eukprot:3098268-Pyramimonas_sp.AAC.1